MMNDVTVPTRERLLDATVALMRTKGAAATGTKEILERAHAPRGSFYFHFPEGKDQLVLEALGRAAADTLAALVEALGDNDGDLAEQITTVFDAIADELGAENYGPGCAVGVTTLESAATSTRYQQAVGAAFETWTSTLTDRFVERGINAQRAEELADTVVASLEGATMLARARHDTTPLHNTARMLAISVNAALDS
jgi:TetR/AcrR family transcriptional repressor of lmrAB and yxaGH operons